MTKAEKAYLSRVAALGCIVCRDLTGDITPAEIHHRRGSTGAARREDYTQAIPLCSKHHRLGNWGVAYHAGPKEFEKRYGTQRELVERTQKEAGLTQ